MIENILIIDTETTGLSPAKGDKLIEVAAVLFNVKHKAVLQNFSTLLPCETNPVEHINNIKAEATQCTYPFIKSGDVDLEKVWENPSSPAAVLYQEAITLNDILIAMADSAQACVAHNAKFDKQFIALLACGSHLLHKKWICTKEDFAWPVALLRNRLQDICHAMRVPYHNAHRALTDCLLLAQCFEKIDDLEHHFAIC